MSSRELLLADVSPAGTWNPAVSCDADHRARRTRLSNLRHKIVRRDTLLRADQCSCGVHKAERIPQQHAANTVVPQVIYNSLAELGSPILDNFQAGELALDGAPQSASVSMIGWPAVPTVWPPTVTARAGPSGSSKGRRNGALSPCASGYLWPVTLTACRCPLGACVAGSADRLGLGKRT